jgi:hypothetical protein
VTLQSLGPLASTSGMRWMRTQEKPVEFTLLAGDAPVAILRWTHREGSVATAETAEGSWTLRHEGFLSPRLTARTDGSTTPIARLTPHLRHHLLEVAGGETYRFHRTSLLLPAWQLTTIGGQEVVHLEPVPEGRRLSGGAVVLPESKPPKELLLLLAFTWYFIVLAWFEDETAELLAPFEGPDAPVRLGGSA